MHRSTCASFTLSSNSSHSLSQLAKYLFCQYLHLFTVYLKTFVVSLQQLKHALGPDKPGLPGNGRVSWCRWAASHTLSDRGCDCGRSVKWFSVAALRVDKTGQMNGILILNLTFIIIHTSYVYIVSVDEIWILKKYYDNISNFLEKLCLSLGNDNPCSYIWLYSVCFYRHSFWGFMCSEHLIILQYDFYFFTNTCQIFSQMVIRWRVWTLSACRPSRLQMGPLHTSNMTPKLHFQMDRSWTARWSSWKMALLPTCSMCQCLKQVKQKKNCSILGQRNQYSC